MPPDEQFMLGQIIAKLDTLISRTDEDRKAVSALAERVKRLEEYKWKLAGAAAALGGAAGFLSKLLE